MRKGFIKVALIPAVALLVFASGCNVTDSPTDANFHGSKFVLYEKFCVTFDEHRASLNSGTSEIVCDQFATDINQWFADNNVDPSDVCLIFQSGGKMKLGAPYEGSHDWDITSKVMIERVDINDGPKVYLRTQTVTVPDDLEGWGEFPRFDFWGVLLVDRALGDLVDGGNPVLKVTLKYTDVDPEPSESDPLDFSWQACVDIVAVVCKRFGHGDDDDN